MIKEEIRIKKVIVHILDSLSGAPVLSDTELEFGTDLAEFLQEHISRVVGGDDCKSCRFYEEESEVYKMVSQYQDEFFVDMSKDMAGFLYDIMNENIDIPPADLFVVQFDVKQEHYLALLKMNYKEFYTHHTVVGGEDKNTNQITKYRSILPAQGQKLSEAAVINLTDFSVKALEKKYEVNGEKVNYFTYLFLKCSSQPSHKSKLAMVSRAVENVQKEYVAEDRQFEANMRAKQIIHEELEEKGSFVVEELAERIFEDQPEMKYGFRDQVEKYGLEKQEIAPSSESTVKKYQTQYLKTDSGIEIKIPMKEYRDPDSVEFITQENGNVSVLIKNIGHLQARL